MKKKIILTTIISLLLTAVAASAQTARPNFSGFWELDASKSVLPDAMRIESMTMNVTQTEKEIKIETIRKRAPLSEADKGETPTDGRRGGSGTGRGGFGGSGTVLYSLPDNETTVDIGSGAMSGKETRKPTFSSNGKMSLTVTRSFNDGISDVTMKTNEIWEMFDDGKTLKVTRYTETPRGATNAELYFTKKPSEGIKTRIGSYEGSTNGALMANGTDETPKRISGGVLNGKALKLSPPQYPAAARAVKASGAVNVQVTIDEQGNIISASAVSGHPLLRQAAEQAARQAQFAPILLSGVPVQVTGVLVYNFVP